MAPQASDDNRQMIFRRNSNKVLAFCLKPVFIDYKLSALVQRKTITKSFVDDEMLVKPDEGINCAA